MCLDDSGAVKPITSHVPWRLLCCETNHMCLEDCWLCCGTNHMCFEDCCAVRQITCSLRTVVLWNKSHVPWGRLVVLWNKSHVPWGLLCCKTNHMFLEDCCAVKQITCSLRTVVLWNKSHVPWGLLCCGTNHMCLEDCCAVKRITCALRTVVLWNKSHVPEDCCAVKQIACALRTVALWNKSHVPCRLLCCETNHMCLEDCCTVKQGPIVGSRLPISQAAPASQNIPTFCIVRCLWAISQLGRAHTVSYLRVTCYVPLQVSNTGKEEKIFPKCYFGNRSLQEYSYQQPVLRVGQNLFLLQPFSACGTNSPRCCATKRMNPMLAHKL